jgi:urea transport system substrate-binding protein
MINVAPRWVTRHALYGLCLLCSACSDESPQTRKTGFHGEVKVGILHSRSGTMAFSEGTAAEGEALAIEEINANGGIQLEGKRLRIVPVEEDGESDPRLFAEKLRKLIDVDQVSAIFGGWTSASRKAMLPVIEEKNHLLFYPIQYEGQECSPNIFYGGETPNQQIEPAITWLVKNKGRNFFLIGSDYVFPKTANRIVRGQVRSLDATIQGEHYVPLGSMDVTNAIRDIRQSMPNGGVIINTLNGESNLAFFKAMKEAYLTTENGYFVMSFSIAEQEVSEIGAEYLEGSYASWSFFQTLDTPNSRRFTKAFKYRFGNKRVTSDPTESGYTMVHLWAKGVEKARSLEVTKVRDALVGVSFESPEGPVEIHPNHHLRKLSLIGEIQKNGMFKIVANHGFIEPKPWNRHIKNQDEVDCASTSDGQSHKDRMPTSSRDSR